jgi:hypothetical protein
MAKARYFILNGVRRALASREAGRKTVPAIIYQEGKAPKKRPRLRLSSLFASKATVELDLRFLRIEPPIFSPIEVEILGRRGQPRSVPLAKIRLG